MKKKINKKVTQRSNMSDTISVKVKPSRSQDKKVKPVGKGK